jgi:hypothetical protein
MARTAWGPSAIIRAMSTLGLHLGLDAACPVVPCKRSAHSGLAPIGHECAAGRGVRGALQPNGLIGHEWEADRRLCRGLVLGIVNATDHLWWVGLRSDEGSTRVIPLWFAHPYLVPPRPTSGSMSRGSSGGGCF